jgi:hypothetical protein
MSADTLPARPAAQLGCYVYAIIGAADGVALPCAGIDGGVVRLLHSGGLAAVVSELPNRKLRPERRRVAAHHAVLKHLLASCTVLPLAFGVIAESRDSVSRILDANQEACAAELERLGGAVEMGLRVVWDVPNLFEYFLALRPELRALRDELFRGGQEPGRDALIDLGRRFEHLRGEERAACEARVRGLLAPCCREVRPAPPRSENEVTSLACLVGRDGRAAFERGVFEAARHFDNHLAFDLNGPWPPYSFLEVTLQFQPEEG